MTRDKVREAIDQLRTQSHTDDLPISEEPQSDLVKASIHRSHMALEALLRLREELSHHREDGDEAAPEANPSEHGGDLAATQGKPLQTMVKDVLDDLQRKSSAAAAKLPYPADAAAVTGQGLSESFPTAGAAVQDVDIIPILTNDPDSNFWQFLDFAPSPQTVLENGDFSAPGDLQDLFGPPPSF